MSATGKEAKSTERAVMAKEERDKRTQDLSSTFEEKLDSTQQLMASLLEIKVLLAHIIKGNIKMSAGNLNQDLRTKSQKHVHKHGEDEPNKWVSEEEVQLVNEENR